MTVIWWVLGVVAALFGLTVFRGAPYVPSRSADIATMFDDLCVLSASDVVVDIGSGDGKVCMAAAERGARAVGYEINPVLVAIAKWRARKMKRATFYWRDFWKTSLPDDTTVVYTFGDSRDIAKMAAKVLSEAQRLHRDINFVSYAFEVPNMTYTARNSGYFLYKIGPTLQ